MKTLFFSASGTNQRHEQGFQYAHRQNHPFLQFLPLMLAEWVAKNLAYELGLPHSSDECSSTDMNNILSSCLLSDRRDLSLC